MEITLKNGNKLNIHRDDDAECPFDMTDSRIWDWYSNNRRWNDHADNRYRNPDDVLEMFFEKRAKTGASEVETKDYYMVAIYVYQHGVTTISLSPFSCPWDSGIGYIAYIDKNAYRKEFGGRWNRKHAMQILKWEVNEFDTWLQGDVFAVELLDSNGEWLDGCGGFYGKEELLFYIRNNFTEVTDEDVAEITAYC